MGPEREVSNAELARDLAQHREELREFREWVDDKMVPREVYEADRRTDAAERGHLEYRLNVIEQRGNANRQLALSSFILPVLVVVIGGLLLVALGVR